MRRVIGWALSGVLIAGWSGAAAAALQVNFVLPETYTDAGLRHYGASAKQDTFREIERELQRLAARYLSPGETLTIDILDIDLAGRFEPWVSLNYDIRFMRDITWPRIKLRYALDSRGAPLRAEETVSDMSYLDTPNIRPAGEPLSYEKAMLGRWFRARFVERRPALR